MPSRRMTVFFTVVLLIWTTMNVYVFWRISSIPVHLPRAALVVAGFVLWASYIAGRILARQRIDAVAAPLEWIGSYWLGVIFFILISFLVVDIITGFGYLLPQRAPTFRIYALGIAGILSVIALVQGFRAPVVSSHQVRLAGLPTVLDGTVLAVATDTHVGETVGARWLSRRVDQIQALRPDLIILGGDIVEGDSYGGELREVFRRFSAPLGVFAVT